MSKLPTWARKPDHKKTVIATERGWTVKETGEVLRLVSDLPSKLKQLFDEAREIESTVEVQEGVYYTTKEPDTVEPSEPVSTNDQETDDPAYTSEEKTVETLAETEKAKDQASETAKTDETKKPKSTKKSYYQRKKEQREQQKKEAE